MTVRIEITGNKKMLRKLEGMAKRAPLATGAALFTEAESIMADSKTSFVPVDLGTLRASGHVKPPVITPRIVFVKMGYGGAAIPYALAVHEHPSRHSPPSWKNGVTFNVGGPKYLEKPVKNAVPGMALRIAAKVKIFLEGIAR